MNYENAFKMSWRWSIPGDAEPSGDLKNALDEHALSRIGDIRPQGYVEGELCAYVDGVEYRGWWKLES